MLLNETFRYIKFFFCLKQEHKQQQQKSHPSFLTVQHPPQLLREIQESQAQSVCSYLVPASTLQGFMYIGVIKDWG